MANTDYQYDIEEMLGKFDEINHRSEMAEQIETYIKIWQDFSDLMPTMNMMASLMNINDEQQARKNVASYIAQLEAIDASNDYPEWYDGDDEQTDEWLARNSEIMTAIEMCNIDY